VQHILLLFCLSLYPIKGCPQMVAQQAEDAYRGSGVQFTRPDGTPIFINPHAVAYVRAPLHDEVGNATIVFTAGGRQSVIETVEQVIHGIHMDMPRKPGGE
jgi:hypothetical protein